MRRTVTSDERVSFSSISAANFDSNVLMVVAFKEFFFSAVESYIERTHKQNIREVFALQYCCVDGDCISCKFAKLYYLTFVKCCFIIKVWA